MDRIHHPSAIATPPPVDAHATPGYPTEGNPGGGIEATIMTAYIGHSIIEEIRNVVGAAGLTPDKADLTQLLAALRVLCAGQMAVFATVGVTNVTVPVWATKAHVQVWGGGGGGGGAANAGSSGGGGAGGGYAEGVVTVTPGASIAVTIGTGGVGGSNAGGNGGSGGTSSFGALMSAPGGLPGAGSNSGGGAGGGSGGAPSGGALNVSGGGGQVGLALGGNWAGGNGGAAFGGSISYNVVNNQGASGSLPAGGGGGAGSGAYFGGPGAAGLVFVRWMP